MTIKLGALPCDIVITLLTGAKDSMPNTSKQSEHTGQQVEGMGQGTSRSVFDSLLAKTHIEHALIQPDGGHNDIPTVRISLLWCLSLEVDADRIGAVDSCLS